jgi:hypothetical protein
MTWRYYHINQETMNKIPNRIRREVQMDETGKDSLYNPEFLERFDPSLLLRVEHGFLHSGANVTQTTTRRWIFRIMGSFRSICSSFALPGCECSYKLNFSRDTS